MFDEEKCTGCGKCIEVCERGAIVGLKNTKVKILRNRCNACGRCEAVCHFEALKVVGRVITVRDVIREVLRDLPFYKNSNGGVTASGGEPLFQPDFTEALFRAARSEGINTALDTSGFAKWSVFERVLRVTDFLLYDIKGMDPERHKRYTGVSNDLILENLIRADRMGVPIFIRVPVIPDANFKGDDDFRKLAEFLSGLESVERIDLLPYHTLGEPKAKKLGRPFIRFREPDEAFLAKFKEVLESIGLRVTIGGLA